MTQEVARAQMQPPVQEQQGSEPTRSRPLHRPPADIFEQDGSITLVLDMPGVAADDVDVSVESRVLTVRGHSRIDHPDSYRQVYAEYVEGDYERSFTLSRDIDVERIEARCRNGVLTLSLPLAATDQARQISVRSG